MSITKSEVKGWTIEIAIVVVGILIAFSLNGWAGDRADRELERRYLTELLVDLEADSAEVRGNLFAAYVRVNALGLVARQFENDDQQRAQVDALLANIPELDWESDTGNVGCSEENVTSCITYVRVLDGNKGVYDEMVGSGNLRVISNTEISLALARYYAAAASIKDFEHSIARRHSENLEDEIRARGIRPTSVVGADYDELVRHSKQDRALQSAILFAANAAKSQARVISVNLVGHLEKSIDLVRNELNSK